MRDSIMMYRTQCEALEALPPDQFKAVATALWHYELDGIDPNGCDSVVAAFWMMSKPLIDKRTAAYEHGKMGGRPKEKTTYKPPDNLSETTCEPVGILKDKEERIKDKELNNNIPASEYPYKEVVTYLNQKAGTAFKDKSKDTRRHIKARFDEGYTLEDFRKVIDGRVTAWKGTDMEQYLRPSTLFGSKFESYLNAKPGKSKNAFNNFSGRVYDFDELERKLTGVNYG